MFAPVYDCPNCGEVWRDIYLREEIDCDRDDVEYYATCSCGREVMPKTIDGKPVWHALTEEEMDDEHWQDCMRDKR